MKLQPPRNENYAATVVTVGSVITLPNCDNVVAVPVHGYHAIVSKDVKAGDRFVLFGPETQLSESYARHNNLYRHPERNADPESKGYLEDNTRVKALKFRGNISNALLMPLSSLGFSGDTSRLKHGDTFDYFNGVEICRKYNVPLKGGATAAQTRKEERIDNRFFPKHIDTSNYFRHPELIGLSDYVTVTQKLHGTSVRVGHVPVPRKLTWKDKVARWFGVKISETDYDYVYGSRNVTKDPNNPDNSRDFYETDIFVRMGKTLEGLLPKGYVVYGEIVGWAGDGKEIQPGFTYGLPRGEARLYVYRVTHINPEGLQQDLSWSQLKGFAANTGLKTVPELYSGYGVHEDLVRESWIDVRLSQHYFSALPTDGTVDEGVVIRKDGGNIPLVLKAKGPEFLELETKQLDTGECDYESVN